MRARGLLSVLICACALGSLGALPGTAAATTTLFCKENVSFCGNYYPLATTFTGSGSVSLGAVTTCSSSIAFKTLDNFGAPLRSRIDTFGLSSCSNGCTVTAENMSWQLNVEVNGSGPDGSGKIIPSTGGNPGVKINGCGQSNCIYLTPGIPEFVAGGALGATLKSSGGTVTNVSGSGCAASLKLTMSHTVPPIGAGNGLYVTS